MGNTASRLHIGIDPALNSTGIAVYGAQYFNCNLIKPPAHLKEVKRLAYQRDCLKNLIKSHDFTHCCIEGPSLYSVNRADDIGQLRGVFLITLYDFAIPFVLVPPTSLKKYGGGNGNADKDKMIGTAKKEWPGHSFTGDTADAAWLAHISRNLKEENQIKRTQLEVLKTLQTPKPKKRFSLNTRDV